jgi:undecaprenyl-diphosphatase
MEPRRDPALAGLLTTAAVCAAVFAGLTWYVVARAPATRLDRRAQNFVLGHRVPWLNAVLEAWTWLGSTAVLIPLLLAASGLLWWGRRDRDAVVYLWVALAGAAVLYQTLKVLIGRARPPVSQMLTHTGGYAYPSGHATQAITVWGLLAVLAVTHLRRRTPRALVLGIATVVIVLVGVSRIYLGVHWVTDVVGGYALGATWIALLLALPRAVRTWRRARSGTPG